MQPQSSFIGLPRCLLRHPYNIKKALSQGLFRNIQIQAGSPFFSAITPALVTWATPAHRAPDHYGMDSPAPARSRECGLAPAP